MILFLFETTGIYIIYSCFFYPVKENELISRGFF